MRLAKRIACGLVLILFGCGEKPQEQARGGGLEGETLTLEGRALQADGTPAAAAEVRLRASDASDSADSTRDRVATTDADGRYRVAGVEAGDYVLITEAQGGAAAFQEVHVAPPESAAAVLAVPPDTVKPKGAIRVRVVATAGTALPQGYLQVVGLGLQVPIDTSGIGFAGDLPKGTYFVRAVYPALGLTHRLTAAVVKAGDTLEMGPYAFNPPQGEDLSTWKYVVPIRLNTAASGANVAQNVLGFPVLLRLDSSKIAFEKMGERHDAGDLRFTDAKGKALPFEIENWDGPGRKAQVWVRVDTVYGNRADQVIYAHYGKEDVFATALPRATFDTADDARAVWHFALYNPGGWLSDATAEGNTLRMGTTRKENGIAGQAWTLQPGDELGAAAAKSQEPASLTVSGWFKPKGAQSLGRLIWKHRRGEPDAAYSVTWLGGERVLEFALAASADGKPAVLRAPVPLGQEWTHFAAAFDAAKGTATLYVNGNAAATLSGLGPIQYRSAGDLMLGSQPGGLNGFRGALDEVRLYKGACTPARALLEYKNQKPGAGWAVFGAP